MRWVDKDREEQIELRLKKEEIMKPVRLYATTEYTGLQMEQIRLGIENGLTEAQIRIYADIKYDHEQMKQIRLGLEKTLPDKEFMDMTMERTETFISNISNMALKIEQKIEIALSISHDLYEIYPTRTKEEQEETRKNYIRFLKWVLEDGQNAKQEEEL